MENAKFLCTAPGCMTTDWRSATNRERPISPGIVEHCGSALAALSEGEEGIDGDRPLGNGAPDRRSLANDYLERFNGGYSRTDAGDGDCAMSIATGGALWDAAAQKILGRRVGPGPRRKALLETRHSIRGPPAHHPAR